MRKAVWGAVGVVALIVVAGVYVYLPGLFSGSSATLSFKFEGGTAVYSSPTGLTNVTLRIRNTGTALVRLGGESGVAPSEPYQYVVGSFHAYFFNSNGTQVFGGGGTAPDTSDGGLIVATYLVSGAPVGAPVTITTSLTSGGQTHSQTISLVVVSCLGAECASTTTSFTGAQTTTSSSTTTSSDTSAFSGSTSTTFSQTTTVGSSLTSTSSTSTYVSSTSSTSYFSSTTTTSTTATSTITSSTTTNPTTATTTTATSTTGGTLSWAFANASASYNSGSGVTSITVWIQNTGTISFGPKATKPSATPSAVPNGTTYVLGTWSATFYSSDGSLLCSSPCPGPPDTANGGWIEVHLEVTGAQSGDLLILTYTVNWDGLTAGPHSTSFIVS